MSDISRVAKSKMHGGKEHKTARYTNTLARLHTTINSKSYADLKLQGRGQDGFSILQEIRSSTWEGREIERNGVLIRDSD